MQAKLRVIGGEEQVRQIELRLPAVVGRSRTTDVTLFHPLVSRQHCELYEADGWLMVRDLGSLNGTFVEETRLTDDPVPLEPGARLTVGCVTLLADYQPPASDAPSDEIPGSPTLDASTATPESEGLRFDARHLPRPSSRVERRPRD